MVLLPILWGLERYQRSHRRWSDGPIRRWRRCGPL